MHFKEWMENKEANYCDFPVFVITGQIPVTYVKYAFTLSFSQTKQTYLAINDQLNRNVYAKMSDIKCLYIAITYLIIPLEGKM